MMGLRFQKAIGLFAVLALAACATNNGDDFQDPFEPLNRKTHAFNMGLDKAVIVPVTKGYKAVTPDPVEAGINNFFDNLTYPTVFTNQFLQGKFVDSFDGVVRFGLNSTFGIAGLFDVASTVGIEEQNEDFGQTLATWGVPSGPYVVLPLLGGMTVRQGVGTAMAVPVEPTTYLNDPEIEWSLRALSIIDTSAEFLDQRDLVARDSYLFLRDTYFQRRQFLISDGSADEADPFLDE